MSPELVVRHDHYPSVPEDAPADSWLFPAEAVKELERAVVAGNNATVMTESVGFTGFGTSPMQRVRTIRLGIITGFEPGSVTMEVKSGFRITTVEGIPFKVEPFSEEGGVTIPALSETHFWGDEDETIPKDSNLVTSTEYISSIEVEGGQGLGFYPPPSHIRFP